MLACLRLDSVQQEKVEDVLQHLRGKNLYGLQRRVVRSFLSCQKSETSECRCHLPRFETSLSQYESSNRL
mgnify:CR=1 FL=1